jgi:hypothetical protein
MILIDGALQEAAGDFHFLLNRGYPRKTSLELIGNRYNLPFNQRHLLHRGIFSDSDAKARKERQISLRSLRRKNLAIDGYNVLITIESALSGRPLISSNDGFIRDISGLSGNFRKTKTTDEAIQRVLEVLKEAKPRHALFLFDAPISKSGLLAREVREFLKDENLSGDARAVKVPEKTLVGFPGIVATSDTAIIDQSPQVMDLAGHIIRNRIKPGSLLKFEI